MREKVLSLCLLIFLSFTLLVPSELLSRETQLRERPPAERQGEGPVPGFANAAVGHLQQAHQDFQSKNIVNATVQLLQARESLERLQKQIQDAQTRINDAVQYLNEAKPEQASASVTLALDALNPSKQATESRPAPIQRDKRENLRAVREDMAQARERFKAGDVAGAIQHIRSAQDTLEALQRQYPEYQSQLQEAQSRLNETIYFLNQNKPRDAAMSAKSVTDILEPLREAQ